MLYALYHITLSDQAPLYLADDIHLASEGPRRHPPTDRVVQHSMHTQHIGNHKLCCCPVM